MKSSCWLTKKNFRLLVFQEQDIARDVLVPATRYQVSRCVGKKRCFLDVESQALPRGDQAHGSLRATGQPAPVERPGDSTSVLVHP